MKTRVLFAVAALLAMCSCSPQISNNVSRQTETVSDSHPDYAVVHIYRPGGYVSTPYDVYIGSEKVYRSKKYSKKDVRIYKSGPIEIWGETDTKEAIQLDVEVGKDYYVRSDATIGTSDWRPNFTVVEAEVGKGECSRIQEK